MNRTKPTKWVLDHSLIYPIRLCQKSSLEDQRLSLHREFAGTIPMREQVILPRKKLSRLRSLFDVARFQLGAPSEVVFEIAFVRSIHVGINVRRRIWFRFGDDRLRRRLERIAEEFGARPNLSIPSATSSLTFSDHTARITSTHRRMWRLPRLRHNAVSGHFSPIWSRFCDELDSRFSS